VTSAKVVSLKDNSLFPRVNGPPHPIRVLEGDPVPGKG